MVLTEAATRTRVYLCVREHNLFSVDQAEDDKAIGIVVLVKIVP